MTCILSIFESRDAKRARVEAKIVERCERFRASPTVTIGSVTVINPTFEGPNPYEELVDPDNDGVLVLTPGVAARRAQRRSRVKSEAYSKAPWFGDKDKTGSGAVPHSSRYSAPPLTTAPADSAYASDEDPFRKDPVTKSIAAAKSFPMDIAQQKRKARRRTVGYYPRDYLQVAIPDQHL